MVKIGGGGGHRERNGRMDGQLDGWRKGLRGDWLTFTWGRTFILVPDAPLPMGALGKQGCHLLTGRRITKPPKHTVISTHGT